MSLTSELNNSESPISQYFSKSFDFNSFLTNTNLELHGFYTLEPSNKIHYPWSDVGHITEYLMLIHIGLSIEELFPMQFAKTEYSQYYQKTLLKYQDTKVFLISKEKFSELITDLYKLSKIEGHFRSGKAVTAQQLNNLNATKIMLQDITNLYFKSLAVNPTINDQKNFFCYNPTFDLSGAVGGADADLYLIKPNGNFLIDLKTTIKPIITKDMLHQLLGYVFLDESNSHQFKEIGIYLTRQNLISCWNLEELISNYSSFKSVEEAKQKFCETVKIDFFSKRFLKK